MSEAVARAGSDSTSGTDPERLCQGEAAVTSRATCSSSRKCTCERLAPFAEYKVITIRDSSGL